MGWSCKEKAMILTELQKKIAHKTPEGYIIIQLSRKRWYAIATDSGFTVLFVTKEYVNRRHAYDEADYRLQGTPAAKRLLAIHYWLAT